MCHTRQSSLGIQVKAHAPFQVVPSSLGSGCSLFARKRHAKLFPLRLRCSLFARRRHALHRRRRPFRDGPASGENRSHLCRLVILGYFGLDPPKRRSGLLGNTLMRVQTEQHSHATLKISSRQNTASVQLYAILHLLVLRLEKHFHRYLKLCKPQKGGQISPCSEIRLQGSGGNASTRTPHTPLGSGDTTTCKVRLCQVTPVILHGFVSQDGRQHPAPAPPKWGARDQQLLRRYVRRFRGGLVSQAHRLLYRSTPGSRVIKKRRRSATLGKRSRVGWLE